MSLKDYGWNEHFQQEWDKRAVSSARLVVSSADCSPMQPARVIADYGQLLRVVSDYGESLVSRPVQSIGENIQIAVGDWVAMEFDTINKSTNIGFALTRKTKFSRTAAGIELKEQIVAANVDYVFLIQSLNNDFNMRRLERYLIAAWESGATPVVVLTKADCCEDVAEKMANVYETAPGVDVHAISCVTGQGIDEIKKYFDQGKTVALLGSSGVGKSTLANTLAGEELLKTQEIRGDDSKGRHTTTHRELILLPDGGLILDTPGMRALSLWEADAGMNIMFGDIEELVTQCRFFDCTHGNEPGCAIRAALDTGKLVMKRWESWQKLQKELKFLESKKDGRLRYIEKQHFKKISKFQKEFCKGKA